MCVESWARLLSEVWKCEYFYFDLVDTPGKFKIHFVECWSTIYKLLRNKILKIFVIVYLCIKWYKKIDAFEGPKTASFLDQFDERVSHNENLWNFVSR